MIKRVGIGTGQSASHTQFAYGIVLWFSKPVKALGGDRSDGKRNTQRFIRVWSAIALLCALASPGLMYGQDTTLPFDWSARPKDSGQSVDAEPGAPSF